MKRTATSRYGIAVSRKCAAVVRRFRNALARRRGRMVTLSEAIEVAVVEASKK